MKVIHKFPVEPVSEGVPYFTAMLPDGAEFLHVEQQKEYVQMWWMLDPKASKFARQFRIVATGEEFDAEGLEFLGTFFVDGGSLVFHLFQMTAFRGRS